MPFKRGDAKPVGSGRRKLSPAKRPAANGFTGLAKEVQSRLAELNCDPITGMVLIANDTNEDSALRFRCYAELANYVYPKRRAVEIAGPAGGPIPISADPFDAITRELSRLAERSGTNGHPPAPIN